VPAGSPPQANTRNGAWRLAAQAPSAPRGVPGESLPQASGGSRGVAPPGQHCSATAARRHAPGDRRAARRRHGPGGRAVLASGRRGALPPGDRLLSFEVGYSWSACPAAGQCRPAADTTATPFAARRYVAGHADTGRFLTVTETATEVVETSPATFSFSVKSM